MPPIFDFSFFYYNSGFSVAIWLIIVAFLAAIYFQLRLFRKRLQFIGKVEWQMLEIKVPKEIIKTPKSMEQVFAGFYGIYSFGIKPTDKYLDGKVDLWISLEIVAKAGGIYFYVRTPKQYRNLVESSIYAQYPEVEMTQVDDYTEEMPLVLPNETFDVSGTGYKLSRDNPYPIKTYHFFEEVKDEKRVDPLAALTEAMSNLSENEMSWIQLLISPTGPATGIDLKKEGEAIAKEIIEKKSQKRTEKDGKETISFGLFNLTPGDQDAIKAIENKTSKLAFQITLRSLFITRKENGGSLNEAAINSAFQQFNTQNLNGFKPDDSKTSYGGWRAKMFPWYKRFKVLSKKRKLYDSYIKRKFGTSGRLADEELPILTTEELATLFHFPSLVVGAPKLMPIHSRKGGAPFNLPVEQ